MAKKTVVLALEVEFDDEATDPESLASALDILMDTALSTPGILDEEGPVTVGAFFRGPGPREWSPRVSP